MILLLLKGALVTLGLSIASMTIGLLLGSLFGVLSCEALRRPLTGTLVTGYVTVVRGTPLFIQLLLIYFALPEILHIDIPALMAGLIALGLNSAAYLAESIRAGLNSLPRGQWEACTVLGYSTGGALRFVILPQAIRRMVPALTNELISLIKESSILMVIGVHELTKVARDLVARELKPMEIYLAAGLIYLTITTLLGLVTKRFEGVKDGAH